jgi:hypothetical protein
MKEEESEGRRMLAPSLVEADAVVHIRFSIECQVRRSSACC